MRIMVAGVAELSFMDYPGSPALVIFVPGCPFQCPMCQNWRILEAKPEHEKEFDEFLSKIRVALGAVDAVKVSGGEPTLYPEFLLKLSEFCRDHGLLFGFDTNGYFPDVVKRLLGQVDLVSVDVKAAFNDPALYSRVIGVEMGEEAISRLRETLKALFSGNVYVDVRTTLIPTVNDKEEHMKNIGENLARLGYVGKALKEEASYTLQELEPNLAWKDEVRRMRRPTLEEMVKAGESVGLPRVYIRKANVGFMVRLDDLKRQEVRKLDLI
ncbi:MAG: radical SAM protein [Candidatus Jordarchaeales archaeon]|nr:radical SAM protein [Candidatus Jordarchaeia archaeon]